jgi:hypothetical protein
MDEYEEYVRHLEFKYRPTNKRVYSYAEIFPTITAPISPVSIPYAYQDKPTVDEITPPMETSTETQVNIRELQNNDRNKYDPSLHYDIPKSELDIPLYTALKLTTPQQIPKYVEEAQRYNYDVDPDLTTEENTVLVNNKNKIVVFGVRGTNPESTKDVLTDVSLLNYDVKSLDRYKYAKQFLDKTRKKYPDYKMNIIGWSLGGIIASELGEETDKIYSFNRPFFEARIKPNEKSISVEGDFLLNTLPHLRNANRKIDYNPDIIPRIYYEKARDYYQIERLKINPDFETKSIKIPEIYKNDDVNTVAYKSLLTSVIPVATSLVSLYNIGKSIYSTQPNQNNVPVPAPVPVSVPEPVPPQPNPPASSPLRKKPSLSKKPFFVSSRDTTSPIKSQIPVLRKKTQRPTIGGGGVAEVANTLNTITNDNVGGIQSLMSSSSVPWAMAGALYPVVNKVVASKFNQQWKRLENIHAVENLPLSIRIEK